MATVQKTTMKRYNGTDWDPVYLANSADITYIGSATTVAKTNTFYSNGDIIAANTTTATLIASLVNRLVKLLEDEVPAIKSGETITSLAASKLTGTVSRSNLPTDVGGKGVTVASEDEKAALDSDDVNVGDLVRVTGGKVYVVNSFNGTTPVFMELTNAAGDIAWSQLIGVPSTLDGFGITDAVHSNEKVFTATASDVGKIVVINAAGALNTDVTGNAGTATALETSRNFTITNGSYVPDVSDPTTVVPNTTTAVAFNGTAAVNIQLDRLDATTLVNTVPIGCLPPASLERLHVVTNNTALASFTDAENGDTIKVVSTGLMYYVKDDTKLGTASYVDGLEEYTAGAASSVPWSGVTNTPTTIAGYGITDAVHSNEKVTTASASNVGKILTLNSSGKLDVDITGNAATASSINWSNVNNTPTTIAGYGITDAVNSSEKVTEASAANVGKILVLNSDGKLDVDITGKVDWSKINNKPSSTVTQIDNAVAAATHTNRATLDLIGSSTVTGATIPVHITYNSNELAYLDEVNAVALGSLKIVSTLPGDASSGQLVLQTIS